MFVCCHIVNYSTLYEIFLILLYKGQELALPVRKSRLKLSKLDNMINSFMLGNTTATCDSWVVPVFLWNLLVATMEIYRKMRKNPQFLSVAWIDRFRIPRGVFHGFLLYFTVLISLRTIGNWNSYRIDIFPLNNVSWLWSARCILPSSYRRYNLQ